MGVSGIRELSKYVQLLENRIFRFNSITYKDRAKVFFKLPGIEITLDHLEGIDPKIDLWP